MIEGFIPDAAYGAIVQTGWHAGTPKENRFLGMKTGVKCNPSDMVPITTYRCGGCGLLKSYAHQPTE